VELPLDDLLKSVRRSFVMVATLLGLEVVALGGLAGLRLSALFLGFIAFAVTHDLGRVLGRSPRLVQLVRARQAAAVLAFLVPLPLSRRLRRSLQDERLVRFACDDPRAAPMLAGLDGRAALRLGEAASALGGIANLGVVLTIIGGLAAVALPGMSGDLVIILGPAVVWMMLTGLPSALIGGIAQRLLVVPTAGRRRWAGRLALLLLPFPPFATAAGARAAWILLRPE
jgi:hypothetical protein